MKLTPEIIDKMNNDRSIRRAITRRSHALFFIYYMKHFMEFATAPFQEEFFRITEDDRIKLAVITAFRESSKSTIFANSYLLWAIMGRPQAKLIVIMSKTQMLARQKLADIRAELEDNEMLRADMGPFDEIGDQLGVYSIYLKNYNAQIIAASREQGIRGLKRRQHRPQIIVLDDVEDLDSTKTRSYRDDTYQWFTSEVLPLGSRNTKVILIGNVLHEDSLIMRLKAKIDSGKLSGIFRKYPIIDDEGRPLWPGKYPTAASLEQEKMRLGDDIAWQREFMLKIIPREEQLIHQDQIKYYEKLPDEDNLNYIITAIDPAFKQNENSDPTAMVTAYVYGSEKDMKIYIGENVINKKLAPHEVIEYAKNISMSLGDGVPTTIIIEDVAGQYAFIDLLKQEDLPVEGFQVHGQDKYARLSMAAPMIQNARVFFAKHGNERLTDQLLAFPLDQHDDMVDALTMTILYAIKHNDPAPCFWWWIDTDESE